MHHNLKNIVWVIPSFFIVILIGTITSISLSYSETEKIIPGFKVYNNSDYQIQIQHPKKWVKSEENLASNVVVSFTAPDTKDISSPAGLNIAYFQISKDDSLDEFIQFFFKKRYTSISDYKMISTRNTTLSNMNAQLFIIYDYDNKNLLLGDYTLKVMRILAIDNNGNGYSIRYYSEPGLFNKYLPIAEKMISTFKTNDLVTNTTISSNITTSVN